MKQTGFDDNKISTLYVVTTGDQTKIGITNRPIKHRLREINSDSKRNFKVLKEYSNIEGSLCRNVESTMLKILSEKYKNTSDYYTGSSECFIDVDNSWLLNTLETILRKVIEE